MLQTPKYIVIIICLPSVTVSIVHYHFAPIHILCNIIGKSIAHVAILYAVGLRVHYIHT